jgi:hypothetical protein
MNCGDSWDTNLVLEGHQTLYTLDEAISSRKVQSLSALVSVASASEEDGITFLGHSGRRNLRSRAYETEEIRGEPNGVLVCHRGRWRGRRGD